MKHKLKPPKAILKAKGRQQNKAHPPPPLLPTTHTHTHTHTRTRTRTHLIQRKNKLAAYFVHTLYNLGIADPILPRHTCDNTLQSAPSALICEAEACCCCRMEMLFSSSLTVRLCGFYIHTHTHTRARTIVTRCKRGSVSVLQATDVFFGFFFCRHVSVRQKAVKTY